MRRISPRLLITAALIALTPSLTYAQQAQTPDKDDQRTAGSQPAATDSKDKSDYSETYRQLQLFGDVFERVRAQYVEPVEDQKLIENALNGMLSSLDPHSSYMNEKQFEDMQVTTKGEFGGLGIEVTMENNLVKVVSPIDDTPAAKAGIQTGDYIVEIDGKPVINMTLAEAVDKMRGKVGSTIKLMIRRPGVSDPLDMTLTRDVIKIESVKHKIFGNVGYIRITTFSQNTDPGLLKAVEDIKKQLGDKLAGYIIDLRNDPGGLLDQAIAVSDDFLDKGEIVSTRGRHESDTKRDNATPGDIANGLPMVLLINGGSASASEIVAGALQDNKRAILLGTRSFGKGSVQTVIPIPGYGAIRLTTARYFTPSGRSIQAKGIDPDIVVEPAKIETLKNDTIHESDLPGALSNPDQKDDDKNKDGDKDKDNAASPATPAPGPDADKATPGKDGKDKDGKDKTPPQVQNQSPPENDAEDYQLQRGIDLLNGLSLYNAGSSSAAQPATPAAAAPAKPAK